MSSFQGMNEPHSFEPMQVDSLEEPLQPFAQNISAVTGTTAAMTNIPPQGMMAMQGEDPSMSGMGSRRSLSPDPLKKKRKLDPASQMQILFDFMRKYRREDGVEICEAFIRAPKRRTDPAYYEVVSDPIDMLRIQQKLKMDEYADMDELQDDFQKLFTNALAYYKKGSQEHKDATEMSDLFTKAVAKVEAGEDPSIALGTREESEETELNDQLEELFATVMTATDPVDPGRPLNLVFRLIPSQKRYPEYFQVITEPIDLKTIATKIVNGDYSNINQCEEDLNQMCKNAMTFNEPGSQIYRDAKAIFKLVKSKKNELDVSRIAREGRGIRATRRGHSGKKQFAMEIANIPLEESESDEESSEDDDEGDTDDPLWMLYNSVRYFKTAGGLELAEPFLALPSKRELPDYYLTIAEPIALNIIRKKIKSGEYLDHRAIFEDLTLMFDNCKTYNRPDSRLYKDACKLQKALKQKLDEIESGSEGDDDENDPNEDDSDSEDSDEKPKIYKTPGRKPLSPERKMMRELYNTLMRYRSSKGVQIISIFMDKPSRREYPDYYEIIDRPMDMRTINEKIKSNAYKTVSDCLADFRLMFTNCRKYNEEGSDIYNDAMMLERVLMANVKVMQDSGALKLTPPTTGTVQKRPKQEKNLPEKMKILAESLRDYKDPKGRQLSLIFLRLPNAKEFPDYYEVIKRPIDFEKIANKIKQNLYPNFESCFRDFELLFDNACQFNEPDSQIYKDALTLHGLAKQTFRKLSREQDDESNVPDVNACVQEILVRIFTSMYNHQDSDERCFSDALNELPEYNMNPDGTKVRAVNLDIIKRRLDKGLYKRLDLFQRDIFAVLERARKLSRTDSQAFEDSVELQSFFIKTRDEACDHGEILQSRALLYTQSDLMRSVEDLKAQKQLSEQPEDDGMSANENRAEGASTNTATFNQEQYRVGDFVYVESKINRGTTQIYLIENMYTTKEGQQMMYANHFYRPQETFHLPSRKFLEQEVFCSDVHQSIPLGEISGRCCVMSVRDFFRVKPEGFEDKDVFVCENRYNSRAKSFKKMKIFWIVPEHIKMVPRPQPLELKRIQSVFKERVEKHKEEIEEQDALEKLVEIEVPPNVVWENPEPLPGADPNNVYFEQYSIPGPITLRRGDAVYVRAETGKNLIAQIDSMWTATDGMAYFHGPWFVTPSEIQPSATSQVFYKQEAMISTIQDTNPLLSIVGVCCIMEMDDYTKSRPTQYDEYNVYVCENVYDESRRIVRSLPQTGLKGYDYQSTAVIADEVFYFKSPIQPQKELPPPTNSRLMMDMDNDDSLDAPASIGSAETSMVAQGTKKYLKPASTTKAKVVTPYIVFASEIRKSIIEQNKARTFGEISKLVGDKWKTLSDTDKILYDEKARRINEENAVKHAEEVRMMEEQRRRQESGPRPHILQQTLGNGVHTNDIGAGYASPRSVASPSPMQGTQSNAVLPVRYSEPIFHTLPTRPQRLLHSDVYIRYIEGLTTDSHSISNWDKQLRATKENTKTSVDLSRLPTQFLEEHTSTVDSLWALREFMTVEMLGLTKL